MTAKIKICGLMNYESADVAAKAGADYLGFVYSLIRFQYEL